MIIANDRLNTAVQAALIARSFEHWFHKPLLASPVAELDRRLFEAPFVLLSHGTEPDPVLNYGNAAALKLWEMSWDEFTSTPSRLTAEPINREERALLLDRVSKQGFIDDYQGIRITKSGRRFFIPRARVWNLLSEKGTFVGQAAMFEEWGWLS